MSGVTLTFVAVSVHATPGEHATDLRPVEAQ